MEVNSLKPGGEIVGGDRKNPPCNPDNAEIMGESLAMVYSPKQYFADIFSEDEALFKGTMFKKLWKPLEALGEERAL